MIIRLSFFISGCILGCKQYKHLIINIICGAGGTLYRQKRTIRYKRNTPAFLGKGSYYCCNLFRSLVFLKRTDHGKRQCLDQANRRDSFRHVAEICVYIHPRFLVCTLIPERMLQESCFSSAFLR